MKSEGAATRRCAFVFWGRRRKPKSVHFFRLNGRRVNAFLLKVIAWAIPQLNGQSWMNHERLKRLAALLEGYRDRDALRFDLQSWGISQNRRNGFLWLGQRSCNTAACAVGLACDSGIFAEDGLSYEVDKENSSLNPVFRNLEGWSAVKSFFDLDQAQAVTLFAEHSYEITQGEAAAQAVAARIRRMTAPLEATAPQERLEQ